MIYLSPAIFRVSYMTKMVNVVVSPAPSYDIQGVTNSGDHHQWVRIKHVKT